MQNVNVGMHLFFFLMSSGGLGMDNDSSKSGSRVICFAEKMQDNATD